MSVYVVRAFVQFRAALGAHSQLASKLAQLEQSLARLDRDIQRKFEEGYEAIRTLASAPTLSLCDPPALRGGERPAGRGERGPPPFG